PLLLKERHVARDAAAPRRARGMVRVRRGIGALARVTAGALAVVEASLEGPAEDVAIGLRVRVVAVRADHRPVHRAVAQELVVLIAEARDPAVRREAPVPKRAELEGIAVLERLRRPRPLRQEDLVRVAREADFERLLLPEQLERSHPDVGPRRRVRRLDDLD